MKRFSILISVFLLYGLLTTVSSKTAKARQTKKTQVGKLLDTIDIDGGQDGGLLGGSGDDTDNIASGDGDDEFESSGDIPATVSPCLAARVDVLDKKLLSSFVPQCTADGHFAPVQCHGGTGACWCVDVHGREIVGSRRRKPAVPDCSSLAGQSVPETDGTSRVPSRRPASGVTPSMLVPSRQSTTSREPFSDDDIILLQPTSGANEPNSKLEEPEIDIGSSIDPETNLVETNYGDPKTRKLVRSSILGQPGILAGIIGAAVVALLCAVLLVMFIVYRMRKKHEPIYTIDKRSTMGNHHGNYGYTKALDRDMYA